MKPVLYLVPVALALLACRREETARAPKAVEVEESPGMVAEEQGIPKAIVIPESQLNAPGPDASAEGRAVIEVRPASPSQPRKRLPQQVMEKVGQGLETAGQKTREAAVVAEERTEEAIGIAREKTETGLRDAANATGKFLKRAGEKIEEKAKEAEEP
jgi:hypothetical protein